MALITIKEYGERHGVSNALMRQRCDRGCFRTARKVGRDWMVDEEEEFLDQRKTVNRSDRAFKKIRVNPEYASGSWADEFREFYPVFELCEECRKAVMPKFLDIQLQGVHLMNVPYEQWRPTVEIVLGKVLCEKCAERNLRLFDEKYGE